MAGNYEIAQMALASIKVALEDAKKAGQPADMVFIGSELRYKIAAFPNDALTHELGKGDFLYGVPVIRYTSDDESKFFLARAYPVDRENGYGELIHRPYYKPSKLRRNQ